MAMEKQMLSNVGSGLIGDVLNVVWARNDYKTAREQGYSKSQSVAKAAGSFAWGEFYYGGVSTITSATIGKIPVVGGILSFAAPIVASLGWEGIKANSAINSEVYRNAYQQRGKLGSGHFNMTQAGYTMRQRSLNAIRSNGLNLNSALGNEARTYFRSV